MFHDSGRDMSHVVILFCRAVLSRMVKLSRI